MLLPRILESRALAPGFDLHLVVLAILPSLMVSFVGCGNPAALVHSNIAIPIPTQSEWIDYGPIFASGAPGEWDHLLWGGFTGSAVKKDGIYYLYYQGASDYQTIPDETVIWRAIGVATSPDGINFAKYDGNPVVTWFPNNEGEEGATAGAATLDDSGEIVLYYGANTARSTTRVNADGRLATSANGFSFTDQGIFLDHRDCSVWGSGDELFPIIALHDAGQWVVYYLPNGSLQNRTLGVAWGNDRSDPSHSSAVSSGGSNVRAWGMGGSAKIGPDTYALFLNDVTKQQTEVRTMSLGAPNRLSAPVETYQFDGVMQATVLLDEEAVTWFMYYRSESEYGVKLAPAGQPDTTPPTAPEDVNATPTGDGQIELSWGPATDADTGIVLYKIFRDGVLAATVKGWRYRDADLAEQTGHSYAVSAVNYHGVEGPRSAATFATTPAYVAAVCSNHLMLKGAVPE